MIPDGFTGFVIGGSPVDVIGAGSAFLIALTALIWTIIQEINAHKLERTNTWMQQAIETLFKRYKEPVEKPTETNNIPLPTTQTTQMGIPPETKEAVTNLSQKSC